MPSVYQLLPTFLFGQEEPTWLRFDAEQTGMDPAAPRRQFDALKFRDASNSVLLLQDIYTGITDDLEFRELSKSHFVTATRFDGGLLVGGTKTYMHPQTFAVFCETIPTNGRALERSDAPNRSPWSVTRTLLVAAAALVVLFEVLDVGRGRFGSRLLGLLAAAFGASSTAVDWLRLARVGFTAIVGGFGFYWASSRVTSFPPFIRAALFGARVLVTLGLSVAFSVWARHSGDFEDILRMLPDALALVGCWSYAHACWESRLIASRRAGTPESAGATVVS